MPKLDICRHYRQPESKHHKFEPIETPENCRCNPLDWGDINDIPPVCKCFEADTEKGWEEICKHCQHEISCHY